MNIKKFRKLKKGGGKKYNELINSVYGKTNQIKELSKQIKGLPKDKINQGKKLYSNLDSKYRKDETLRQGIQNIIDEGHLNNWSNTKIKAKAAQFMLIYTKAKGDS